MMKKVGMALGVVTTGLVLSLVSSGPVQAAVAKAQAVFVSNTADEPVPTKAIGTATVHLDNVPAVQTVRDQKKQYFTQVDVDAPASEGEVCSDDPLVPAGKRMIVDTVLVEVAGGDQAPTVFVYGGGVRPFVPLAEVQHAGDVPGGVTTWGGTEQLHLIFGQTDGASFGTATTAELTGRICVQPKGQHRSVKAQFNGVLEDL